jgi:hypothetical protein
MPRSALHLPGHQDSTGGRNAGLLAIACALATGLALAASVISALAQPGPSSWPFPPETFESTGGGGWMISQYRRSSMARSAGPISSPSHPMARTPIRRPSN